MVDKDDTRTPFLKGTPRVNCNDLELVPDSISPDDDGLYFRDDKPFNGVVWEESQGCTMECSIRNGERHGRCVRIHANGEISSDGYYEAGLAVGKHFDWYESGVMEACCVYGEWEKCVFIRNYNEAGALVREVDEQNGWRLRHWTDDGYLSYESRDGICTCYAPDGNWMIREHDQGEPEERELPVYRDEILYEHAFQMLGEVNLVNYPIYRWLETVLDRDEPRAKKLLIDLVSHSSPGVVKMSLGKIRERQLDEAATAVRVLASSGNTRKHIGTAGIDRPLRELAEFVLVELTAKSEEQQRIERGKLRAMRAHRNRVEKEREIVRTTRRGRIQLSWPRVEALFDKTLVGQLTLQAGDNILVGETSGAVESQTDYWHYYRYVVDGRTYRACVVTLDPQPSKTVSVGYRIKNPVEHVVDAKIFGFTKRLDKDNQPS